MHDGLKSFMESPYECWNLCKKTKNCVGINWGKCDSQYAELRKTCWLKSKLVGRSSKDPWSITIRYKGRHNT